VRCAGAERRRICCPHCRVREEALVYRVLHYHVIEGAADALPTPSRAPPARDRRSQRIFAQSRLSPEMRVVVTSSARYYTLRVLQRAVRRPIPPMMRATTGATTLPGLFHIIEERHLRHHEHYVAPLDLQATLSPLMPAAAQSCQRSFSGARAPRYRLRFHISSLCGYVDAMLSAHAASVPAMSWFSTSLAKGDRRSALFVGRLYNISTYINMPFAESYNRAASMITRRRLLEQKTRRSRYQRRYVWRRLCVRPSTKLISTPFRCRCAVCRSR